MPSDLRELRERLEKATGPDNPDLARDLCKAFVSREDYPTIAMLITDAFTGPERWQIGAALALVERMLPGRYWLIGKGLTRPDEPLFAAQILWGEEAIGEAEHKHSAALAICAALLSALDGGEHE